MASTDSDQWLFTDEELRSTPSILHGVDPKVERQQRAKGTNFILQAAILLKIPQITIGVASTFLHRFYMRASMDSKRGYHHYVCDNPSNISFNRQSLARELRGHIRALSLLGDNDY
jgi:protein BUR2